MGLLGDIARENIVREVLKLIDERISRNKGEKEVAEVLRELRREVEQLLPYDLRE